MKNLLFLLLVLFGLNATAQMTTRIVRDSLFIPWELVYGPDNNIWFTQKNGYICRMVPASGHIDTLYHETNTVIQNEGGMLGMALHPSFPAQPYVYVAYEYTSGGYKERIVRYTYSANSLSSPLILLDNITGAGIHNGCRLVIVTDKLFITTGDAGVGSNAQNLQSVNGKTLRINLDGSIPADNPIAGSPLWTWGNRNAQGLVYANGKLYSSEHGPGSDDELNILEKGRNYGWPSVAGYCNTAAEITFCNDSNVVEPLRAWTPTLAVCGIDYYNHAMFPTLQNSILMTTLKDSKLYRLKLSSSFDSVETATAVAGISFGRLRDICVAPDGKIYISTSNSSASGSTRIDKIIEIYDPTVNPVQEIKGSDELAIYPNPAGDHTVISMASGLASERVEYIVTDGSGKVVLTAVARGNNISIPTKQLPVGLYQVKLTTQAGKVYRGKIMKQ